MPNRGRFITLEGGEGAGKSTLLKSLASTLEAMGMKVVITREPGGTPLAESVRELVLYPPQDAFTPIAEALLMNAARAEHVDTLIKPSLEKGAWVLSDRFSDSTLAYQSSNDGTGIDWNTLKELEAITLAGLKPDVTFILDAPVEKLLSRRGAQDDTFERRDLDFHRAVRRKFLKIANEEAERCIVLDAMLDADAILSLATDTIVSKFELADAL